MEWRLHHYRPTTVVTETKSSLEWVEARVPTTLVPRGCVKLHRPNILPDTPPQYSHSKTTRMIIARGCKEKGGQETQETTMIGVITTVTTTCPCVRDNDHYYLEEAEKQTTATGVMTAQKEWSMTITMTRKTAMRTIMQDRFEDRYRRHKKMTSFEGSSDD